MDLPALIMVNPVLAEPPVLCLCELNDVLNEFAGIWFRAVLHRWAVAEKEQPVQSTETDEDDRSS